ncbi:TlpA disulfide reductase family protein [Algoriphagus sp. NG3]|uniref:TlpA family protein disulfide reductase n=1 Tax=Algoriphagus sp. NG3 TaxID=3097546 RepID=UPI002A7F8B2C|nr:TlpA disulfide reductase family protein [Algoriphagus sp. NG3]WPR75229.1 TlpA disulfide reductase family protein [Algoriphagus sp. NG3]
MKKNILLCLVGYLCLCVPTSTLLAQVADSPGADFLHRSSPTVPQSMRDTHRGGETRSDTFTPGFGLADTTYSAGQGGGSSAAAVGEAYIYGEVISGSPLDTAHLTVWNHFLDKRQWDPVPIRLKEPLQEGNIFEGSFGKRVFEFSVPILDTVQIFSLSLDRNRILNEYLIEEGDSIRLLINLRTGQTLFSGTSGPKYNAQHLINQSLEASRADQVPAMITTAENRKSMTDSYPEMYQKSLENKSTVRKSLRFIETRRDSLLWLRDLSKTDPFTHPAWNLLQSQSKELGDRFSEIIPSRIFGRLLANYYKFAQSFAGLGEEALRTMDSPEIALGKFKEETGFNPHAPELVDLLLARSNALAVHQSTNLFSQFDKLPPSVRDRIYGKFLMANAQDYAISAQYFDHAVTTVETPWIRELIRDMRDHMVKGADLSQYTFKGTDGYPVSISEFEGKLVLVNFWLSGCKYCYEEFQNVLHPTEEYFKDDPRVRFLSVSADRVPALWKNTLQKGGYTSEESIPVYAGLEHSILKDLGISGYPRKVLLGPEGELIAFQDLPRDQESLIRLINEKLESFNPQPIVQ